MCIFDCECTCGRPPSPTPLAATGHQPRPAPACVCVCRVCRLRVACGYVPRRRTVNTCTNGTKAAVCGSHAVPAGTGPPTHPPDRQAHEQTDRQQISVVSLVYQALTNPHRLGHGNADPADPGAVRFAVARVALPLPVRWRGLICRTFLGNILCFCPRRRN